MPSDTDLPAVTLLNGSHPDQTIYRVFEREHLDQMVEQGTMALVRPELWQDPFENLVHQGSVYLNGKPYGLEPLRRSYFAQCWTLKAESDAMWRIYSEKGTGIRIKTSVRKLSDVLLNKAITLGQEKHAFHKCFIGKVLYSDMSEIIAMMNDSKARAQIFEDVTGKRGAQTLLHKRLAFDHEQEVRAIYNNVGDAERDYYPDVLSFNIPKNFVEEICFDPRLYFDFEPAKQKLLDKGVTVPIICSDLYAPLPDNLLWHHANNPT